MENMPSPVGYLRKLHLQITNMAGTVVLDWDADEDVSRVRCTLAAAGPQRPQAGFTGWLERVVKEITASLSAQAAQATMAGWPTIFRLCRAPNGGEPVKTSKTCASSSSRSWS